jgi:secreted PhoX family phosphatase
MPSPYSAAFPNLYYEDNRHMSDHMDPINEMDSGDEPMSNHSNNPHFSTILDKRLSRRQVLTGSLSAAIAGVFGAAGVASMANAAGPKVLPPAAKGKPPFGLSPTLGFEAIPVIRSDTTTLPYD